MSHSERTTERASVGSGYSHFAVVPVYVALPNQMPGLFKDVTQRSHNMHPHLGMLDQLSQPLEENIRQQEGGCRWE